LCVRQRVTDATVVASFAIGTKIQQC